MSDRQRVGTAQEAPADAATRTGPVRYESALARYLAVVGGSRQHERRTDETPRDELYWNIENNLVRDVMTREVICVSADATFKDIVETLEKHRVSAVPVVDDETKVVGIVSESDLLAKVVAAGGPRLRIRGRSTRVERRRKSHAETARELMHSPAVTTRPEASVVHAARTAALAHARRLPVTDAAGTVVGIVTRSDLLRVFLREEEAIFKHLHDLFAAQWCIDTSAVDIAVHDGIVTLTGEVERRSLVVPLVDAVRTTAGVVGVHDNLRYRHDDTFIQSSSSSTSPIGGTS
jgi:CBS domain-containing protein